MYRVAWKWWLLDGKKEKGRKKKTKKVAVGGCFWPKAYMTKHSSINITSSELSQNPRVHV